MTHYTEEQRRIMSAQQAEKMEEMFEAIEARLGEKQAAVVGCIYNTLAFCAAMKANAEITEAAMQTFVQTMMNGVAQVAEYPEFKMNLLVKEALFLEDSMNKFNAMINQKD